MNENELKALLRKANGGNAKDDGALSEEAKKRSIALALAEYDAAAEQTQKKNRFFFQGFLARLRLKVNTTLKTKEKTMNHSARPWIYGTASATCALVLAFTLGPFDSQLTDKNATPPTGSALEADALAVRSDPLEATSAKMKTEERVQPAGPKRAENTLALALSDSAPATLAETRSVKMPSPMSLSRLATVDAEFGGMPPAPRVQSGDTFAGEDLNPVKTVKDAPVSTFSIDVDTASYSFVRRSLNEGRLPPKDAVRIEEMVNYFDYRYPKAESREQPFHSVVNVLPSPWNPGNKLVHVGIRAFDIEMDKKPRSNLVFLLDVSGSMNAPDKLPLVKQSMHMLLNTLNEEDTVAIAVYAGAAGTILEPTPVRERAKILAALKNLQAGGSTAGGEGIELAYQLAETHFDNKAVNRIFLATDGDFNVGISDTETLKSYIERKRESGIFLSILGFGRGNYNDQLMQALAQNGNGVAAYIDTLGEAQKVLVEEANSTLFSVAKDVKIQLEFNPQTVSEYRLIGYETRALKNEDFNNDKVDAGDIGAGHTVTALYEITPVGSKSGLIDDLRYAAENQKPNTSASSEYGFLKLRYKLPDSSQSRLLEKVIPSKNTLGREHSLLAQEIEFSAAVAGFAQLLKDDKYLQNWRFDDALALAQKNKGEDVYGYRSEFIQLIRKAQLATEL